MADKDKNQTSNFVTEDNSGSKIAAASIPSLRTQRATNAATEDDFSPVSLKKLSELRRGQMQEVREKNSSHKNGGSGGTQVVGVGMKKKADFGAGFGSGFGGGGQNGAGGRGNVDRGMPEIYSPLFQVANLNLPRDRMTMNAWNRNFFDTHPIVRNAITLHATYPISKINVKCKHRKVEQFFNDMAERIDLFEVIADVAFEYFKIGEAFPYAELDENSGIWSSIVVQNPDYITVKKSGVSNIPLISLRPDEVLKKIITSNHPADIKLRSQIPDNIIHHIKKNEPIPLDNFNISHLKMLSSPYDVRGTSMIVSCYKDLMRYDKLSEAKLAQADSLINPITLISVGGTGEGEYHPSPNDLEAYREIFECYDEETEVLTDDGFKKYYEIMNYEINKDGKYSVTIKNGIKIACFNANNENLEYYDPISASLYDYNGSMYHFKNNKIDICVTPNHDMWVSDEESNHSRRWKKVKAKDISTLSNKVFYSDINLADSSVEFSQLNTKFIDEKTQKISNTTTTQLYIGKVWCFSVPTGLFITRRNGKITIQGNSAQWDKDFKIITHAAIKVERIGASGAIVDTQNDFNFIRENLYAGLMVPKSVMDTEGSAYASASIGLEVLRTRYISFRNMVEKWLKKKIFAPISQIHEFFEYRNGEKVLIVPDIDWNHINLYDLNDYIQALGNYVDKNKVSVHTLYRSLGLNWEEEQRLIREEAVRGSIMAKEAQEFQKMSLTELRALDPDEPIIESQKTSEPVPGEAQPGGEIPGMPPDFGGESDSGIPGLSGMGSPPEGGMSGEAPSIPASQLPSNDETK